MRATKKLDDIRMHFQIPHLKYECNQTNESLIQAFRKKIVRIPTLRIIQDVKKTQKKFYFQNLL